MVSRRKFIRNAAAGTVVVSSPGIFFPKPAITSSINYRLKQNATSTAVFNTLQKASITRNSSRILPPATDPEVVYSFGLTQERLVEKSFDTNETLFTQRLGNLNAPLQGRQRNESLGPNPGFGSVQVKNNFIIPITFTGATTAGIDVAIQQLLDEGYIPEEIDNALMPLESLFDDLGSWEGDINPETGEIIQRASITEYETRYGSVLRRYEVIDPTPDGFGQIKFEILGGQKVNTTVLVKVLFS